ncbi:hypothetical protein H696_05946 [Fonticula alba]|uniref:Cytosol aminopeptidase domain-containing protein n=1 Tax=Fonticula alba TaxID=691883 RepID=A0A058Z077_FONAL|nr:hypothetical protein H696_05946 [Fonticula alba]KCV67655.1 hypothetical protein H696_05946 [Fonticula alba]|eukprot:XP_009497993.1 hypothetical protein H696_05946 [Fonticula alba]
MRRTRAPVARPARRSRCPGTSSVLRDRPGDPAPAAPSGGRSDRGRLAAGPCSSVPPGPTAGRGAPAPRPCRRSAEHLRMLPLVRGGSGGLIYFIHEGENHDELPFHHDEARPEFLRQLKACGHTGKEGKVTILYGLAANLPRVAVAGLGKEEQHEDNSPGAQRKQEIIRTASALAAQALRDDGAEDFIFYALGRALDPSPMAEGALLGLYKYESFKGGRRLGEAPPAGAERPRFTMGCVAPQFMGVVNPIPWMNGMRAGHFQNMARDLMNAPANYMTPTLFAAEAARLAAQVTEAARGWISDAEPMTLKVTAHDRAWAEEQKMGAFLSVTNGSAQSPVFLEVEYLLGEKPAAGPTVLVGKGVTFDTGGISIKPSDGMALMKGDMGGAAVVLATILGVAHAHQEAHLIGLIPLCENMPGGRATKPGDVVLSRKGSSIEVDNTDAEGRLILCDALDYAREFRPAAVLNFATLTGAMDVALGFGCAGVFANDEALWQRIDRHGRASQDLLWRMPLLDCHRRAMAGTFTDLINLPASGRSAGACTAAAFLAHFVPDDQPWAHFDIAGVMHTRRGEGHHVAGMSGRPVRALLSLFLARYH